MDNIQEISELLYTAVTLRNGSYDCDKTPNRERVTELYANVVERSLENKSDFIKLFGGKTRVCMEVDQSGECLLTEEDVKLIREKILEFRKPSISRSELLGYLKRFDYSSFSLDCDCYIEGRKYQTGTKLTKAVAALVTEDSVRSVQDYMSRFTQTKGLKGRLWASVDIRDFATMSENESRWSSCQRLDGEYANAWYDYALDSHSFLLYFESGDMTFVTEGDGPHLTWNNKKWRTLGHATFSGGSIEWGFLNKQYPYSHLSLPVLGVSLLDRGLVYGGNGAIRSVYNTNRQKITTPPTLHVGGELLRMYNVFRYTGQNAYSDCQAYGNSMYSFWTPSFNSTIGTFKPIEISGQDCPKCGGLNEDGRGGFCTFCTANLLGVQLYICECCGGRFSGDSDYDFEMDMCAECAASSADYYCDSCGETLWETTANFFEDGVFCYHCHLVARKEAAELEAAEASVQERRESAHEED